MDSSGDRKYFQVVCIRTTIPFTYYKITIFHTVIKLVKLMNPKGQRSASL